MREEGYQRINPHPAEDAVVWWYIRGFRSGYVYARGGSCATTRQARKLIRDQSAIAVRENDRVADRPQAIMDSDGSLHPVEYGPYGAVS